MKTTWILVADASRARIVATTDRVMNLSVVHELEHPESRMRNQELVTDESGRLNKHGSGVLSATDPRTDAHEEEARKFAVTLAKRLDKELSDHQFESLVLVAPAHFLGLLTASLSSQAQKRVETGIPKDLTRVPIAQLSEHLREVLERR